MTKLQYPLCGPQVCLQRARMFDMPGLEGLHIPVKSSKQSKEHKRDRVSVS